MSTTKQKKEWRESQATYYANNREAWNKYQREYKAQKYATDPEYRARLIAYNVARKTKAAEKRNHLAIYQSLRYYASKG